jgi:DNA-binding MarR family transcriptional regulator
MHDEARAVAELFPSIYQRFAKRRATKLTAQQWAVLSHLSLSGPLTIGEAARHFGRAQSVVSEIVHGLERHGLLERMRDARDKRRTLVWLSDAGLEELARAREVLDVAELEDALGRMTKRERAALVEGMRALVAAARSKPKGEKR